VTTIVKVSDASGALASLPGRCKDARNLDFGETKRVKVMVFSKDSKKGR